jgi:hypothetical protein
VLAVMLVLGWVLLIVSMVMTLIWRKGGEEYELGSLDDDSFCPHIPLVMH